MITFEDVTLLERLQAHGIRRVGSPKSGFRYLAADGRRLSAKDLERCRALVLPPAWTEVRIHPDPRGHLQAVGKDAAGRWQYRYHEDFRNRQEQRKYERLIEFAEALPKMRATVDRDIRLPGMGREKVMACILKVLSTCFIRPGSQVYAAENGSYGIATLRRKHVTVKGDLVHFSFRGKSGKQQERELRDRQVATIIRKLLVMRGVEVFKFLDADGKIVDVKRRHINQYIKDVMGERFSAKDFRTWAGTLIAACALARAGAQTPAENQSERARKKVVVEAVKEAASILGNTPAICRASYIYPSVLSSFERGKVVGKYFDSVEELVAHRGHGLHASEKALVALIKTSAKHKVAERVSSAARKRQTKAAADVLAPPRARGRERTAVRSAPERRRAQAQRSVRRGEKARRPKTVGKTGRRRNARPASAKSKKR